MSSPTYGLGGSDHKPRHWTVSRSFKGERRGSVGRRISSIRFRNHTIYQVSQHGSFVRTTLVLKIIVIEPPANLRLAGHPIRFHRPQSLQIFSPPGFWSVTVRDVDLQLMPLSLFKASAKPLTRGCNSLWFSSGIDRTLDNEACPWGVMATHGKVSISVALLTIFYYCDQIRSKPYLIEFKLRVSFVGLWH